MEKPNQTQPKKLATKPNLTRRFFFFFFSFFLFCTVNIQTLVGTRSWYKTLSGNLWSTQSTQSTIPEFSITIARVTYGPLRPYVYHGLPESTIAYSIHTWDQYNYSLGNLWSTQTTQSTIAYSNQTWDQYNYSLGNLWSTQTTQSYIAYIPYLSSI